MPALDVSDVLLSADLAEAFQVIRREQAVGSNGRAILSASVIDVYGVITSGPSGSRERTAEFDANARAVTVHTTFRLRDATSGLSPDVVLYRGTHYLADRVSDYSHWGAGFTSADCTITDPVQASADASETIVETGGGAVPAEAPAGEPETIIESGGGA